MGLSLKKRIKDRRTITRDLPRESSQVNDRRATDLGIKAEVAPIEVDDPYALNPGDTIVVFRQLRNDPLARMHAHHQLTDVQYWAARRYQRDWELAEQGSLKAIDPSKEKVDGGMPAEPLPESRLRASDRLKSAHAVLGRNERKLLYAFLIQEKHVEHLALKDFNRHGARWANYYGRMLRDALDELSVEYQLASR